jgi:hypothetical protein
MKLIGPELDAEPMSRALPDSRRQAVLTLLLDQVEDIQP